MGDEMKDKIAEVMGNTLPEGWHYSDYGEYAQEYESLPEHLQDMLKDSAQEILDLIAKELPTKEEIHKMSIDRYGSYSKIDISDDFGEFLVKDIKHKLEGGNDDETITCSPSRKAE